jgi:biopolymer transport protein ExbD
MSMRSRRRRRQTEQADLNVTAFMNLMVVLVPFLLIMAVFSRVTILELSLPKAAEAASAAAPRLQLEVIVRDDHLIVSDHHSGESKVIRNGDSGYDIATLSRTLQELKARAPQVTEATVLLEPQVPYEELVRIMDALRVAQVERNGQSAQAELFPEISVGDAPAPGQRS